MIPSLVESWVDVRYFIAGQDNGYKQVLDSLSQELWVSERIYYLGFVSWDDKLSMLQHADYVIFPSEKETFWLVTLEAMASWTTPIINNIWWFVDIVQDWKNGIIVNFSRVEEYRGLIWKNINKDVMRWTVQYYNWKKIAINYLW